jgi:subtilisin family serine protease
VVNLSIGGTASSQTEQLIFRTLENRGIVVVAAMGNEYEDGNPTEYPGAYKTVLAVGAVAENMRRSVFSNTGSHIALVEPGLCPRRRPRGRGSTRRELLPYLEMVLGGPR